MEEENGKLLRDQQPNDSCSSPLFLDLSLSRKLDHMACDPNNPELNLIDGFNPDQSDPNSSDRTGPVEHRIFSCNYCQRKFYSSQALGGHQNAHKRERTLAKRVNSHSSRFSSMASLPLHGAFHHRSLGLQAHSIIHKPIWTSRQGFDHQPAIGRLAHQETNGHSVGIGGFPVVRAPRFDTFQRFSSADEIHHGGVFRWGGMKSKADEMQNKLDLSLKL